MASVKARLSGDTKFPGPGLVDELPGAELHDTVIAFQRERARLGSVAAGLLARTDRRGVWAGDRSRSATSRLSESSSATRPVVSLRPRRPRRPRGGEAHYVGGRRGARSDRRWERGRTPVAGRRPRQRCPRWAAAGGDGSVDRVVVETGPSSIACSRAAVSSRTSRARAVDGSAWLAAFDSSSRAAF